MKAALYARISTHDGRQSAENQLAEMRKYAERRNWEIGSEYIDQFTGSAAAKDRDGLARLLEDARRGRFGVVLVFALDRLTREGILQSFQYIRRLKLLGVDFLSITEPQFQTDGPAGELFLAIAAWMAEQERERLRVRVRAGLDQARKNGVRLGRPKTNVDEFKMKMLYVEGASLREIATKLNCSRSTVERASRAWRQKRRQEV